MRAGFVILQMKIFVGSFLVDKCAKAGLSIEALIEYLALFRSGDKTIPARIDLLKEQEKELQERIDVMQSALDRLQYKIKNYDSHVVPNEKKLKEFR